MSQRDWTAASIASIAHIRRRSLCEEVDEDRGETGRHGMFMNDFAPGANGMGSRSDRIGYRFRDHPHASPR